MRHLCRLPKPNPRLKWYRCTCGAMYVLDEDTGRLVKRYG